MPWFVFAAYALMMPFFFDEWRAGSKLGSITCRGSK